MSAATADQGASRIFLSQLKEGIREDRPDGSHHRACPVCKEHLERLAIGEHPLVVADRCAEHGLWLDEGDLEKIVRSTRAVGMVQDAQPEPDEVGMIDVDDDAMACPNCARRFPGAGANDRCLDCNVLLYKP